MKQAFYVIAVLLLFSTGWTSPEQALNDNDNRTVVTRTTGYYWAHLICDGQWVNTIEGDLNYVYRTHYEKGEYQWTNVTISGKLTSESGEVFDIKEFDQWDKKIMGVWEWHFNGKGDKGSHILNRITLDLNTYTVTIDKALCL